MTDPRMRSSAGQSGGFLNRSSIAGIQIRVQSDPNDPFPRFIELESLGGESICVGDWTEDGAYRLLKITPVDLGWLPKPLAEVRACIAERDGFETALGMLHALGRVALARQLDELARVRGLHYSPRSRLDIPESPEPDDARSLEMARRLNEEVDAAEAAEAGQQAKSLRGLGKQFERYQRVVYGKIGENTIQPPGWAEAAMRLSKPRQAREKSEATETAAPRPYGPDQREPPAGYFVEEYRPATILSPQSSPAWSWGISEPHRLTVTIAACREDAVSDCWAHRDAVLRGAADSEGVKHA